MTFCHECGKPVVPPSAKFCRNCGASQCEESQLPITPAITPFPESAPEPLPVPGNAPPLPQFRQSYLPPQVPLEPVLPEVCRSCGSPIHAYEKFCGICGSSLDSIAKPPSKQPFPKIDSSPPRQPPQPATMKVCWSCGSPLSGTELFCGICGISLNSTSPGLSASQQPDGKTCSHCGKPIKATTKFCGACGKAVGSK
jgi:membrane protease subunit (stomatin/prohibitin family)